LRWYASELVDEPRRDLVVVPHPGLEHDHLADTVHVVGLVEREGAGYEIVVALVGVEGGEELLTGRVASDVLQRL